MESGSVGGLQDGIALRCMRGIQYQSLQPVVALALLRLGHQADAHYGRKRCVVALKQLPFSSQQGG